MRTPPDKSLADQGANLASDGQIMPAGREPAGSERSGRERSESTLSDNAASHDESVNTHLDPSKRSSKSRLIDPRLTSLVPVTKRYMYGAVAVGVIAAVCLVLQAALLASIISRALVGRASIHALVPDFVALAVVLIGRAGTTFAGEVLAQRTSASVVLALRMKLLRKTLQLGPSWFAGEKVGELSVSATRGIDSLDIYFGRYLPQAVLAGLVPLGIMGWVAWQDWVSLLILLGLCALIPITMIIFGRQATKETQRQWRRLSSLSAHFLEILRGLATLRAFGREGQGRREIYEATEGLRTTTMRTLRVAFLSALTMELISGLGVGLVAMVLGLRLLSGSLSLGTALAVLLVSPEVFLPLRRVGAEFHASAQGQAAAQRILAVLDLPDTDSTNTDLANTDPANTVPRESKALSSTVGHKVEHTVGHKVEHSCAELRIAGLKFSFAERSLSVLPGIDLVVAPGEHVAVVGPTGIGKSTLVAAVLGFISPDEGVISSDGIDQSSLSGSEWRKRITWVPQTPHLFSGSIAYNLRIGKPEASKQELREVLDAVDLGAVIAGLPNGLDTQLGEEGWTLSAGERQRIAIARAMLRDAPIVVFDEPAGHLDLATEARLSKNLTSWLESRTVLVVAHRPELVSRIDRTIEFEALTGCFA